MVDEFDAKIKRLRDIVKQQNELIFLLVEDNKELVTGLENEKRKNNPSNIKINYVTFVDKLGPGCHPFTVTRSE